MSLWLGLLVQWSVQAATLGLVAGVCAFALRKKSAALRCLLWQITALAALLLPVTSSLLPAWELRLMPATVVTETTRSAGSYIRGDFTPASSIRPAVSETGGKYAGRSPVSTVIASSEQPIISAQAKAVDWGSTALIIWLAVSLALLAEFTIRRLLLVALRRSCEQIRSARICDCTLSVLHRLNVTAKVDLLKRPGVMPMAWGWPKATILLPTEASEWTQERLEMVLLHECAHILRRDWIMQFLVRLACCTFWFHPLLWVCYRGMQRNAELACDDMVISCGISPTDYAEQLVEVIRVMKNRNTAFGDGRAASVTMAQSGQLPKRLHSILHAGSDRAGLRASSIAFAAFAGIALSSVGAVHVSAQQSKNNSADTAQIKHVERELRDQAEALSTLSKQLSVSGSTLTDAQKHQIADQQEKIRRSLAGMADSLKKVERARAAAEAQVIQQRREIEMLRLDAKRKQESTVAQSEILRAQAEQKRAEEAAARATKAEGQARKLGAESKIEGSQVRSAVMDAELEARKAQLQALQDRLELMKAQYKAGLTTGADVDSARAEIGKVQAEIAHRLREIEAERAAQVNARVDMLRNLEAAQAILSLDQAQFERLTRLFNSGHISAQDIDAAKAKLDAAMAEVNRLKGTAGQ